VKILVVFLFLCFSFLTLHAPPLEDISKGTLESFYTEKEYSEYKNKYPRLTEEIFVYANKYANKCNIPLYILIGVIHNESWFTPNAIGYNTNGSKDYGIMQLNSFYLKEFKNYFNDGEDFDVFNIGDSIKIGCKILESHYNNTKDWYLALCSYNCGIGNVKRNRIPEKTKAYAKRIVEGQAPLF